ncbi:MAG: hypothetical protein GY946_10730, partial [bacterium]|nr:hypothetical protein [bacterium]
MLEDKRDDTGTQEAPAEVAAQEPQADDTPDRAPVVSPFQTASAPEPAAELEVAPEPAPDIEVEEESIEPDEHTAGDNVTVELDAPVNPKLKWFAVHTYSGHENKVRTNLMRRVLME